MVKILIPEHMKENWINFAEAVINSDMKSIPCSLSNTIKINDREIYIELKIKSK